MRKILSALTILLACSLIIPLTSATLSSDLGYNVFSGEGDIAMTGNIGLGLVKGDGFLVVPNGTEVISLIGDLTSLAGYESYFENYTFEGYTINDVDIYTVNGIAYAQNVKFIGFRGNALDNNGGIVATGLIEHYVDGDWTQQ